MIPNNKVKNAPSGQPLTSSVKVEVQKQNKQSFIKNLVQPFKKLERIDESPIKVNPKTYRESKSHNRSKSDLEKEVADQIQANDTEIMAILGQIQQDYILDFNGVVTSGMPMNEDSNE